MDVGLLADWDEFMRESVADWDEFMRESVANQWSHTLGA